ncbi:MAG: hypothetical protein WC600_01825 [Desulfobaccales bacterium]
MFTELNTGKPRIHDYLHFSDIKKEFLIQEGEQGRGGAGVSKSGHAGSICHRCGEKTAMIKKVGEEFTSIKFLLPPRR